MLNKLRNELARLKAKARANEFYFDGYVRYKNFDLYKSLDKQIDKVRAEIELYEQFEGDPLDWEANDVNLRVCPDCPFADDCRVFNNYMNRPARKRFDANGDVIEYDQTGNLKYQVLNLKTGEQI